MVVHLLRELKKKCSGIVTQNGLKVSNRERYKQFDTIDRERKT